MTAALIFLGFYTIIATAMGCYQFFDPIMEARDDAYGYVLPPTLRQRLAAALLVAAIWPLVVYAVLTRGW